MGLRVQTFNKGVFVSLVIPGSPAAMAGLRFGDQLLTLGKTELAGKTRESVHCMLKYFTPAFNHKNYKLNCRCCPVNNIVLAVRDRPLCRSVVLTKDKAGRLGIKLKHGRVEAIAVNSTAARNGLLTDQQIVEVNGCCVVGQTDKCIRECIEKESDMVTVTIMQRDVFIQLMRGMSEYLVKSKNMIPSP